MRISKDFVLREIADEYVLVPVGKTALSFNGLITLNEVGALIWNLLLEEKSIDEIVDKIVEEYEVDKATAYKDTMDYLTYLKRNQIID